MCVSSGACRTAALSYNNPSASPSRLPISSRCVSEASQTSSLFPPSSQPPFTQLKSLQVVCTSLNSSETPSRHSRDAPPFPATCCLPARRGTVTRPFMPH
ncbi:hypothetical protein E2C01_097593 [Portunus trituberculatus]|uniref:Uncharacterized protein n=1 Tax=Portunus trituberculatus TaxID=210409 RepID=A0A5B7KA18_PORTR|nr:hypothetical protein [Portunus trituberculatus]